MTLNEHEEARKLIAQGGDLSDTQHSWLQAHVQDCAACRDYGDAAGRAVRAMRSQPLAADSTLVRTTQMRVRARALELQQQQQRTWLVAAACLFVGFSTAITTPVFWRIFAWMGEQAGVSSWVWQTGFTFFWVVPALVVSATLLVRGNHLTHNSEAQWK